MIPAGLHPGLAQEEGPLWNSLFAVDSGLAVWTVLTFLTLLAVLARYAWKPLMTALDAREKGIQDAIDEARGQREEAEKLLAQHREQLAEGRRQAQAMLAESRAAADQLRKELEGKAREDSQVILANARREIERERNAAVEAVRRASVDVAMAAASRLLSERLDKERDRQRVKDYIDELAESGGIRA